MGLADAGIAEDAQVGCPLEKLPLGQAPDARAQRGRETPEIERRERLVPRQPRLLEQPGDAPVAALGGLECGELIEVLHVTPAALGRLLGQRGVMRKERGQAEGAQPQLQAFGPHTVTVSRSMSAS